jgi:hypothetical protein
MRRIWTQGVLVAVAVFATVIPAGVGVAATTYHESFSFTGIAAEANWRSPEEPAVGEPSVVYVMGADARTMQRVAGSKPVRGAQPAVLAMGLMLPGENGAEPFRAELWCVSDAGFTFTYTSALDAASLAMSCTAQVFVDEPGEPLPGVSVPLTVQADWTGVGPLYVSRSHTWDSGAGVRTMENVRRTARDATAHLTVTGPDGVLLDTQMDFGQIFDTKGTTLYHEG